MVKYAKKNEAPAKPAAQEAPKKKPEAYLIGADQDEAGNWSDEILQGFFITAQKPGPKSPDGMLKLTSKNFREFTVAEGTRLSINLGKVFETLGVKVSVDPDGNVSVGPAQ